jgi:hypothetical protein
MADMIDEMLGLGDDELGKKLGLDTELKTFKDNLTRASKLEGDARKKVLRTLVNIFTPQSYAISDLGYSIDRAEAKAKGKTTPEEITSCCCGDVD